MSYISTGPVTSDMPARPALGHVLPVIAKFGNVCVKDISFCDPLVDELLSHEPWALYVLYERYSLVRYGPLTVLTVRRFFEDFEDQSTNACDSFWQLGDVRDRKVTTVATGGQHVQPARLCVEAGRIHYNRLYVL